MAGTGGRKKRGRSEHSIKGEGHQQSFWSFLFIPQICVTGNKSCGRCGLRSVVGRSPLLPTHWSGSEISDLKRPLMPAHISSQWRRSGQTGSFPISHWRTGSLSIHPKGLKSTLVASLMSVDKGAQATLMQHSRVRQCALCIRPLTCQLPRQDSALWWHAAHKRRLWCNTPVSCFLNSFSFQIWDHVQLTHCWGPNYAAYCLPLQAASSQCRCNTHNFN